MSPFHLPLLPLLATTQTTQPALQRLGAIDFDAGETSPVMFGGRPLLLESISGCYPGNARWTEPEFANCPSYLRIIDLTDGSIVANITGSCNHTFGSAMVVEAAGAVVGGASATPETLYVFSSRWARFQAPHPWCPIPHGSASWGGQCESAATCVIDGFSSSDPLLQTWTKEVAVRPGFQAYNTDVVQVPPHQFNLPGVGDVRYVMAVESKGGSAGWQSSIFVTNSTNAVDGWVALSTLVHGAVDAPVACPCIRYVQEDQQFYVFGAGSFAGGHQSVVVFRSADLRSWEPGLRCVRVLLLLVGLAWRLQRCAG